MIHQETRNRTLATSQQILRHRKMAFCLNTRTRLNAEIFDNDQWQEHNFILQNSMSTHNCILKIILRATDM